jgi:hypothetical protein
MKASILFSILALLIISSCNNNNKKSESPKMDMSAPQALKEMNKFAADTTTSGALDVGNTDDKEKTSKQQSPPQANIDWDKKIIKTANVQLEVKDLKKYTDNIHKLARQYGGYLAAEQQNELNGRNELTLSIKVPVAQFDGLMEQVSQDSEKLISKTISTQDVTDEYVDTKSRLQTKDQMRLKYLDFMKNAKNMKEVLEVQKEINDLQAEIESGAGRINYLSHQSAFSTINITASQILPGYNPTPDNPSFFTRTITAFKGGFTVIADLFVGLISIWPMLLLIGIVWVVIKKQMTKFKPAKS